MSAKTAEGRRRNVVASLTWFVQLRSAVAVAGAIAALALAACQPTVKVEAPDKPIVINLNVKIEQEVRVKIEQQAQEDISKNPDIF